MFLILHNIRSAENVGSMFRTADAFGITQIFLTGYTPAPVDRFKRPVSKIAKTALGAEKTVAWEKCEIKDAVSNVQNQGVRIIALEQDARATNITEYTAPKSWALIVGNEVGGVDQETLALCDDMVEIPMYGTKESLNVAVALGVALYALTADTPVV
ncbi:MAG: TrmH family RNA methyltransferase [Candidatus Pacebacteria bacterium]|nr:TrmH family RNA methyltransferase [Candidatus Paceibacterota bacterium]